MQKLLVSFDESHYVVHNSDIVLLLFLTFLTVIAVFIQV